VSNKGRKKRDPIFPDIDLEETEEKLKTIRFYKSEIERIEEKLEERGKDFSSWVREKGRELVYDQDLKEKIEQLEREKESIKQTTDKRIEEIDKKIEKFKDQLGDREQKIEEIREDIKEYILSDKVRKSRRKAPDGDIITKELDGITQNFDISFKNPQEVRKIYFQEKTKFYKGKIKKEELPDRIFNRWEEKNIVTLGVGSG